MTRGAKRLPASFAEDEVSRTSDWSHLAFLARYGIRARGLLLAALVLLPFVVLVPLLPPRLVHRAIDLHIALGDFRGLALIALAYLLLSGLDLALKMLNNVESDARELSRFENEGKVLAALNHPNVVHVYRLGSFRGVPYIVMEFIEGKKFRDLIGDQPLPLRDILSIFRQVAASSSSAPMTLCTDTVIRSSKVGLSESASLVIRSGFAARG